MTKEEIRAECVKIAQDRRSKPRTKQPSISTMEKWVSNGIAKATDGCKVEPDGICPHGCNSWLLELGLI